jgi:hypothetical protein
MRLLIKLLLILIKIRSVKLRSTVSPQCGARILSLIKDNELYASIENLNSRRKDRRLGTKWCRPSLFFVILLLCEYDFGLLLSILNILSFPHFQRTYLYSNLFAIKTTSTILISSSRTYVCVYQIQWFPNQGEQTRRIFLIFENSPNCQRETF